MWIDLGIPSELNFLYSIIYFWLLYGVNYGVSTAFYKMSLIMAGEEKPQRYSVFMALSTFLTTLLIIFYIFYAVRLTHTDIYFLGYFMLGFGYFIVIMIYTFLSKIILDIPASKCLGSAVLTSISQLIMWFLAYILPWSETFA